MLCLSNVSVTWRNDIATEMLFTKLAGMTHSSPTVSNACKAPRNGVQEDLPATSSNSRYRNRLDDSRISGHDLETRVFAAPQAKKEACGTGT